MGEQFAVLDAVHQSQPTNFDSLDQRMIFQSDASNVERQADSKLFVKFYSRSMKNEEKSIEAGRAVHEDQVFINIKLPGDKNNDVNRVAFPEDINRFPIHYERFRKGQEQVIGTPINALPFLTDTQVEDYKAMFIRTVEQLAGLPDSTTQKILGSITHKQQAQAWLESFKGADRLRQEFEVERNEMQTQLKAMQDQIAKLAPAAPVAVKAK